MATQAIGLSVRRLSFSSCNLQVESSNLGWVQRRSFPQSFRLISGWFQADFMDISVKSSWKMDISWTFQADFMNISSFSSNHSMARKIEVYFNGKPFGFNQQQMLISWKFHGTSSDSIGTGGTRCCWPTLKCLLLYNPHEYYSCNML